MERDTANLCLAAPQTAGQICRPLASFQREELECFYKTVNELDLINVADNSCQGPGISESRHVGSSELVPDYL